MSRDEAVTESAEKSKTIAQLEEAVQAYLQTIAEYETRRRQDEATRRHLHNTIQELKGQCGVTESGEV